MLWILDAGAKANGREGMKNVIVKDLNEKNSSRELDALDENAQATWPGFCIRTLALGEARTFYELLDLARFYRTCIKEAQEA